MQPEFLYPFVCGTHKSVLYKGLPRQEAAVRAEEAKWIGTILAKFRPRDISPVIELGTTSRRFREETKPHIARNVHFPLEKRGVRIVTTDLFPNEGVDIAGDIFSKDVQEQLVRVRAKCILVCNIFEHVTDVQDFASVCDKLIEPSALAIVTVPYSYPYHLDPIDTLFRPSPAQIAALFPAYNVLESQIVTSTTYADDLRASRTSILPVVANDIVRSALLRGGLQRTLARLHRMAWLLRPYSVSCVAMQKR
jgi:hypothetical protein